jgi:hypothetical protein
MGREAGWPRRELGLEGGWSREGRWAKAEMGREEGGCISFAMIVEKPN